MKNSIVFLTVFAVFVLFSVAPAMGQQNQSPVPAFNALFGRQESAAAPAVGQANWQQAQGVQYQNQSPSQAFNSMFGYSDYYGGYYGNTTANWGVGPINSRTTPKIFDGEESELRAFISRVVAREMGLKHFTFAAREEQANFVAVIEFERNGKEAIVHVLWRDPSGQPKAIGEGRHKNGDFREAARNAARDSARQFGRVVYKLFVPDLS